ncbi:MAG: hypothetical protein QOH61_1308, partial [Chloroflexota bacterium]|nr:hypothetical protein [Chloroflexota bacterium]
MPELRPPDVPTGWEIGPPSFVGVGAAGAGTTWWHGLIEAHPDVVRAPGVPESLHYFDEFWNGGFDEADADRYRGFFPRPPGRLTGEWSATYSADFWTPRLLQRAAPHARLLMLVRDPVERFRAGLVRRADADGLEWTPRAAANAAFQRGLYADQVLRIRAAFPAEQLLILQYERCRSSPREELARTFEFLGLDP